MIIGQIVIVSGIKGIIVKEPYKIGIYQPITLCRVLFSNGNIGEPKIEDVIPTTSYYSGFADAMEAIGAKPTRGDVDEHNTID